MPGGRADGDNWPPPRVPRPYSCPALWDAPAMPHPPHEVSTGVSACHRGKPQPSEAGGGHPARMEARQSGPGSRATRAGVTCGKSSSQIRAASPGASEGSGPQAGPAFQSPQLGLAFLLGVLHAGRADWGPEGGSGVAGCSFVVVAVFLWLPSAVPSPVCAGSTSTLYECGGRCRRREGPREALTALVPTCPLPYPPHGCPYVDSSRRSPSR